MISFNWTVRPHAWVKGSPENLQVQTEGIYLIERFDLPGKNYHPMEEYPLLFKAFSELEPNEEHILKFTDNYGWLGIGNFVNVEHENNPISFPWQDQPVGLATPGEGLSDWQKSILEMKTSVEIWEKIARGHWGFLAARIVWEKGGVWLCSGEKKELIAGNDGPNEELFASWPRGDVLRPARFILQKTINKNLKYRVSPVLLWDENYDLKDYLLPENLLATLWLQYYIAVSGKKKFIRCEICGEWMDATGKRSDFKAHSKCLKREWARKKRRV